MTDLTKGIIEIDGFVLTKNSKLTDFDNLSENDVRILTSKRGNKYIKFLKPISSNGVDCYAEVSFYTDSKTPEIKLFPSVPEEFKGDPVAQSNYKVDSAKKWLRGMIEDSPTTDCDEGISYHFKGVHISSFVRKDIHYGLVGGEIDLRFDKEV